MGTSFPRGAQIGPSKALRRTALPLLLVQPFVVGNRFAFIFAGEPFRSSRFVVPSPLRPRPTTRDPSLPLRSSSQYSAHHQLVVRPTTGGSCRYADCLPQVRRGEEHRPHSSAVVNPGVSRWCDPKSWYVTSRCLPDAPSK